MNTNPPKPPKVVVTPEGCRNNLTAGKEYPVVEIWDNWDEDFGYGFDILDNKGEKISCLEIGCGHLYDGNWIIKEREQ